MSDGEMRDRWRAVVDPDHPGKVAVSINVGGFGAGVTLSPEDAERLAYSVLRAVREARQQTK